MNQNLSREAIQKIQEIQARARGNMIGVEDADIKIRHIIRVDEKKRRAK